MKTEKTEKLDIIRIINPDDVAGLRPYFTLTDPELMDLLVVELTSALKTMPDSVLILLGLDSEEKIKVLLVAVNPGIAYKHINVTQLWAHPKTDSSWLKSFMPRIIMWAIALNKTYLRAETSRNTKAFYRRFGFEPLSTVVKYDLKKSGHFDLLTKRPEEVLTCPVYSHPAPNLSLA